LHTLVHKLPIIIMLAVPDSQHFETLGHEDSSHTVLRL